MEIIDNLKTGERRVVTVLFSDMKGFTSLSEKLDPEELDSLMNSVFGGFERIVKNNGGMVEKYIGDALVAVFGYPDIHEDDPSRAVVSALEFLETVRELNEGIKARGFSIDFRTGINTGLITTGKRGEYEVVTGHAMNVAQRLQAEAPLNAVYVSESTKEKCEADFSFTKKISLRLKGKTATVNAYQVIGKANFGLAESGPFVGRKEILDILVKGYMRHSHEAASGFFLIGEAGIGKSRVVAAFIEKIRKFPDFRTPILCVRSRKYDAQPYSAIIDLILCYFGLNGAADPITVPELFEGSLGLGARTAADFIDLAYKRDATTDSRAMTVLSTVVSAIFSKHAADLYPIPVIVDNVSHLDKGSRDFFQYLLKNGKIKPFVLLAGRELPQAVKDSFGGLEHLKLGPFTTEEAIEFVKRYWPENRDEKTAQLVLLSSLGNPLFLREYVRYARENRDVSALPTTVQNVFLSQVEKYEPAARELLKKLSVFLHSFTAADAEYIQSKTDSDPGLVARALVFFMNEGILAKEEGEYHFKLDVFKKALYASLLNYNKRILHGLVADLLKMQKKPNKIRLMYHLIRSESYLEAIGVMLNDPNRTYNYDYLQFIDVLLRHIDKDDYSSSISCLVVKSAILFNSGRLDEAEGILKQIMDIAITKRDLAYVGFAYHQITAYNVISYALQKACFTGKKALEYYRASGWAARGIASVIQSLSLAQLLLNDLAGAERTEAELGAIEGVDPHDVLHIRATREFLTGEYRRALATIEESLASLTPEDTANYFFALDLEIKALWQLCDFARLEEEIGKMLERCPNLNASSLSQANAMLAYVRTTNGEKESVAECFYQAEFYAEQVGNDFERIDALRTLALCYRMTARTEKAEETIRSALAIGLRHSCFYPVFTILILQAEIFADRDEREAALFCLGEARYIEEFGLLLPPRDEILYRWLAGKLGFGQHPEAEAERSRVFLEREKARLADPARITALLSLRGFAAIAAAGGPAASGLKP